MVSGNSLANLKYGPHVSTLWMKTTLQWGSKKNYRPTSFWWNFSETLCNFSLEIATWKRLFTGFWQSYFYWESVTTVLVGIKMKLVHCDGNRLYLYHGRPYTTTYENSILKIIVSSCTTHHQRCCQTFVVISFFLTNTRCCNPLIFSLHFEIEDALLRLLTTDHMWETSVFKGINYDLIFIYNCFWWASGH